MWGEKFNIRFLVKEKTIRTHLTNLYLSLMTTANAEILATVNPSAINANLAHGTTLTKHAMFELINWLKFIEEMSFSNDSAKQILEPVQLVSEYILRVKEKTTKLFAWVFSKSKPYQDSYSDEKRVTISMLVPSLQTCMSLRCTEKEAGSIGYGMTEFSELKPLPFVNRLHQFHPSNKKCSGHLSLNDCNFLKTSFSDLKNFSCSLEMENYCEIASTQSSRKKILGAPLICAGKVILVEWPSIWIRSVSEPIQEFEFQISEQLDKNLTESKIENFKEKLVLFLCVFWYRTGMEPESHPKFPELMHIEEVKDDKELEETEILGFVRIRRNVPKKILMEKYPNVDISQFSHLLENKGDITLNPDIPQEDTVVESFLHTTNLIRDIRRGECLKHGQVLITPEIILDDKKWSNYFLSKKIEYVPILLLMQNMIDFHGEKEFDSLPLSDDRIRSKALWWLKNFDLISKEGGKIRITQNGFEVAYQSQKKKIMETVCSSVRNGLISIPELETRQILPSHAVKFLEEEGGFVKSTVHGIPCKLFWFHPQNLDARENKVTVNKFFEILSEPVFTNLFRVSYALSRSSLLYILTGGPGYYKTQLPSWQTSGQLSHICANIILDIVETQKKVIIKDDFWTLPIQSRIEYYLKTNPTQLFSVNHIADNIVFPIIEGSDVYGRTVDMKRKLVQDNLEVLRNQRIAVQAYSGLWTINDGNEAIENKSKFLVEDKIKNFLVMTLQRHRGHLMDETRLMGLAEYETRKLCTGTVFQNKWREFLDRVVHGMMSRDELIVINGMCKLILKEKEKDNNND